MGIIKQIGVEKYSNLSPSAAKILVILHECTKNKLTMKELISYSHLTRNTVKKSILELKEKSIIVENKDSKGGEGRCQNLTPYTIDTKLYNNNMYVKSNNSNTKISSNNIITYNYNNCNIVIDSNINSNNDNEIYNHCNYDIEQDRYEYSNNKTKNKINKEINLRNTLYNKETTSIEEAEEQHNTILERIEQLNKVEKDNLVEITNQYLESEGIEKTFITDTIFNSYLVLVFKSLYK